MSSAPSPFIPGTTLQYAWDSTSLTLLKECPRKYYYTMIESWKGKETSVHLWFGGVFASALELYHKARANGFSYDDALDQTVDHVLRGSWDSEALAPMDFLSTAKNPHNLLRTVIWYLEEYRADTAETVILANGKAAVELSFRFEIDKLAVPGQPFLLSGHLDRLVDFAGERYVMDQKTTGSALGGYYFRQYSPHTQMSLYTLASEVVFDTAVRGVIIDAAQIMVGFTTFSRGITMRSRAQLDEFLGSTERWLDHAQRLASDAAKADTPIEAYPLNESSCGNYGGCPFRDICSSDPQVRPQFLATHFEPRQWNPLEER